VRFCYLTGAAQFSVREEKDRKNITKLVAMFWYLGTLAQYCLSYSGFCMVSFIETVFQLESRPISCR
jgi:hypothetical protein